MMIKEGHVHNIKIRQWRIRWLSSQIRGWRRSRGPNANIKRKQQRLRGLGAHIRTLGAHIREDNQNQEGWTHNIWRRQQKSKGFNFVEHK
jgi:hypothetical protein